MTPAPDDLPLHSPLRLVSRDRAKPPDQTHPAPTGPGTPHGLAATDRRDRAATEERRPTPSPNRRRRLGRSPGDRTVEHRLGPVEYLLVALIVLGVAITIAVFIVNPSGS